jgi:hypothetical protein
MNKTQVLSATENLIHCLGKNTLFIMKQNRLLDTVISQEQVPPENGKQEVFSMLHFWRHLHNKYTTVP